MRLLLGWSSMLGGSYLFLSPPLFVCFLELVLVEGLGGIERVLLLVNRRMRTFPRFTLQKKKKKKKNVFFMFFENGIFSRVFVLYVNPILTKFNTSVFFSREIYVFRRFISDIFGCREKTRIENLGQVEKLEKKELREHSHGFAFSLWQ